MNRTSLKDGFRNKPELKRKIVIVLYTLVSVSYISLSLHLPISVLATAMHDDAWFIGHAENIVAGRWFGGFNNMTLIKGPAFSYFLALNYLFGLPVNASTALLYLSACTAFVWVAWRVGLPKPLVWALFIFLLFQPGEFPLRVVRDNIYTSLTLIAVSGWAYLTLDDEEEWHRLFLATSGSAAGLYWITREEGIWILPGLIILGLYGVIVAFKNKKGLMPLSKSAAIYLGFAAIPILTTGLVNYAKYGSFQIVDFKSAAFARAVNTLNSVNVGDEIQYVPVPFKKREVIYQVSPAFKELEPYFQIEGKFWTQFGCQIYQQTCGDYAGGWFIWALRDGIGRLGYYNTPQTAERYYNRLSREIELACADGRLSCSTTLFSFMPKIPAEAFQALPGKFLQSIQLSTYQRPIPITLGPSSSASPQMTEIVDFLGNPRIVPPESSVSLVGWYYSTASNWIEIVCDRNSGAEHIPVVRQASPDVAAYFHDDSASDRRFNFQVVDFEKCVVRSTAPSAKDIPITRILNDARHIGSLGDDAFHIDEVTAATKSSANSIWLKNKEIVIKIYQYLSNYIATIGVFAFLASWVNLALKKSRFDALMALSTSLWALYLSRLAILILIDTTSFPALQPSYMMPAFPIWSAAAAVSVAVVWRNVVYTERAGES